MGYYIQTGALKGKAEFLVRNHGGEIVDRPAKFTDIPEGKALVVVVDNGPFEAAGYLFDEAEFSRGAGDPDDYRDHQFVLMDKALVESLTHFDRKKILNLQETFEHQIECRAKGK